MEFSRILQTNLALGANLLLVEYLVLQLPLIYYNKPYIKFMVLLFVAVATLYIPVANNANILMVLAGESNGFSIATFLVLIVFIIRNFLYLKTSSVITKPFALFVVILGCLLYLSAFGFIGFDLYGLGYIPPWYFLVVFVVLDVVIWFKSPLNAWIWLLALIAYYFGLQLSTNLWDYLFDPILWIFSFIALFDFRSEAKEKYLQNFN